MNLFSGIILFGLVLSLVHSIALKDESAIEKRAFPWYSSITLGVQGIYAYFNKQSPVWVKVAWWGAFVAEDGGVMDSVIAVKTACDSCKANHQDPPGGDCAKDAIGAVKSVIMNVVTLTVGWSAPGTVNGVMIDGQHKRSLSEEGMAASFLSKINSTHEYSNNSPLFNSISAWSAVHPYSNITGSSLKKRGPSDIDQVRYFDETNNAWVTLNHIQKNDTCGSLVLSEFSMTQSNNTLQKREYSMYPLCTGYYGVDYCANHGQWAGIYASGELSNQISQMVGNDITGSWVADYYKLYTVEQDGSSEDWQLSFRLYYANAALSSFHWTKCDTGS